MSRRRYGRDPLVWVFFLTLVLSLLGFFDLAREIGTPFGGYVSYRRSAIAGGEVDANTPVWWSGMINDRLAHGDKLLTVDGRPYYPNARPVFAEAEAAGRLFVIVGFLRPNDLLADSRPLPIAPFTYEDFLDARLPDLIMALAFWLLAIVVYASRPDDPTNRAFALSAALVGMLRVLYVHNLFLDNPFSLLMELVLLTAIPLLGFCLLYFASKFPTPAGPRWQAPIIAALVLGLIASAAAVLARLPSLPPATVQSFARVNYYGTIVVYLAGVAGLTGRLLLRLARRRNLSRRERRVLAVTLGGMTLAMPMLLSSAFIGLSIAGQRLSYYTSGLDLRYTLLFVPLAFAYALVRYRAMRAPSLLFLFVILLSFSALVAALAAWVWTWGHPAWPENGLRPPFPSLFIVALVASLVWGGAASSRGLFGRVLHYERRSYVSVRNFGRRITGRTDLKSLPTAITEALVEELELDRAAIWLAHDGPLTLAGHHGRFQTPPPEELPPCGAEPSGAPLRLDRLEDTPDWLRPLAGGGTGDAFDVALPLVIDGTLMGLIALGPRWDEGFFDNRDLENAELIGQQAALFLTATAGMDELRRAPGRMAEVQDRERQRIAQELHDTIQQFLGRLPFYLSVSRDAIPDQPEVARDILDQAINDVQDVAGVVRQIRSDLAPGQLDRGLAAAVEALGRHFEQRSGIDLTLVVDPAVDGHTTVEARTAIYRVIQQSLDNVEAHAEASAAAIRLGIEDGHVAFVVSDNGRGSSAGERREARAQGSYGLESMQARLEAIGGEFELVSAAGAGTEVRGRVAGDH